MKRYNLKTVLEAVQGCSGIMSEAADRLGCSWDTAKKYIDRHPAARAAFDIERCRLVKLAYDGFIKAIEDGERWAIERVLDTSARHEGHSRTSHVEIPGGLKLAVVDETHDARQPTGEAYLAAAKILERVSGLVGDEDDEDTPE